MIAARQIAFGRGAAKGISAKDYVQDGLVAMWDGIENGGYKNSDTSSRTWLDVIHGLPMQLCESAFFTGNSLRILADDSNISSAYMYCNAYDAYLTLGGGTDNYVFRDYGVPTNHFGCSTFGSLKINKGGDTDASQDIICWTSNADYMGGAIHYEAGKGILMTAKNVLGNLASAICPLEEGIPLCLGLTSENIPNINNGRFFSSLLYKDGILTRDNSKKVAEENYYYDKSMVAPLIATSSIFRERILVLNKTPYQGSPWARDIEFFNLRVYSRALTAEEIAHNYEIDKVRFGI